MKTEHSKKTTNLQPRPLVRDLAARVHGQIASDHCRSDLITGRPHWARAGYPFPEVNRPENVFTLVILPLGWTRAVVLAIAAVKGILFAGGSPPIRSNWAKNRQCSNTQRERTNTQPTSNEYNERFFELWSEVVSIPTTAANALYSAPYDGCQDTEHKGTNCRVFGASTRRTRARMKHVATHKTAETRTKLFVRSPRLKSRVAPSHVQVLHSRFSKFNSQKEGELSSQTNPFAIDPTNRVSAQQTDRRR